MSETATNFARLAHNSYLAMLLWLRLAPYVLMEHDAAAVQDDGLAS